MAGCNISPAVAEPACYGVVVDVAAVLIGLTGDVSVRAVTFRDCSNYCHDVFGGEQSDASCFVRHGGLRWWWGSSPACGRVRSGRRCRPLGPLVCKAGQQRALAGCPVRAAKRAARMSRPSWVVLPWRRLSQPDESCAIIGFIAQRMGVVFSRKLRD